MVTVTIPKNAYHDKIANIDTNTLRLDEVEKIQKDIYFKLNKLLDILYIEPEEVHRLRLTSNFHEMSMED